MKNSSPEYIDLNLETIPRFDEFINEIIREEGFENGHINPSAVSREVLTATGKIKQHVDDDFAPWSYILVLRANDAALTIRAKDGLDLPVGRLVKFNAHRMHGLDQARNEMFVWFPVLDAEEPRPLDEKFIADTMKRLEKIVARNFPPQ